MEDYYDDDEDFSDMSYEHSPFESDEDYSDRMEDLNDFSEYFND